MRANAAASAEITTENKMSIRTSYDENPEVSKTVVPLNPEVIV
jgi:hypothetical protein